MGSIFCYVFMVWFVIRNIRCSLYKLKFWKVKCLHQEDRVIRKRWLWMEWTNNDVIQAHDLGDTKWHVNVAFMVFICYCFFSSSFLFTQIVITLILLSDFFSLFLICTFCLFSSIMCEQEMKLKHWCTCCFSSTPFG